MTQALAGALVGPAADFVGSKVRARPRVAIVLGSGLGGLVDAVRDPVRIPYGEIPGFPDVGVLGHAGELVSGTIGPCNVILQSGRFHLYEGHDPGTVILPVRTFVALGIDVLIVTNAAGGLRLGLRPPALMLIADHMNFMFRSPLAGPVAPAELRFPDMSEPYDGKLRALARSVAVKHGIGLFEGVYAGVLGPSYETPEEIRMLGRLGADAVGMSTVPEVIAARAGGIRTLGVSTITNVAAGMSLEKLDHSDVMAAGEQVKGDLQVLVEGVLRQIG
jgi:purine-nucleoside phosphorylase